MAGFGHNTPVQGILTTNLHELEIKFEHLIEMLQNLQILRIQEHLPVCK